MQELIRLMVLQPALGDVRRELHHGVAALITSGNRETARRVVAAVVPALDELLDRTPDASTVLFLLVGRSMLPEGHPALTRISSLHLAHFAKLAKADLDLPYSVQFNAAEFGANRDDLLARYPTAMSALEDTSLGFRHLLLLDRLGAGLLFRPGQAITLRDALVARTLDTEDERAAARALVLRYAHTDQSLEPIALEKAGLQAGLLDAAQSLPRVSQSQPSIDTELAGARWKKVARAGLNVARMAVPQLHRFGTRPRVALCVSGQLRGFRAAFETWQRSLLPFAEFDIYVHTWASIGRASPQPFRAFLPFEGQHFCEEWKRIGTLLGYEEMQARYPELFKALSNTAQIEVSPLKEFYGARDVVVDDETDARFAGFSNQDKMHYKIFAAHQLAAQSGESYDLIMRLRPDLELKLAGFSWRQLLHNCANAPALYADSGYGLHYGNLMMGDQMAIGAPQTMEIYASTWEAYEQIAAHTLDGFPKDLTGHVSLAQTCWLALVDVKALPFKRGRLVEAESLPARAIGRALETDAAQRTDIYDRALIDACSKDVSP
ncbi:MAG: hypothetical protein AAGE80_04970 [Pseudomonadota bacterium]